ncbi:hypothetical protein, partial [Nocardioides psychrotolerans]
MTVVDPAFAKDVDSEGYLNVAKRLGVTFPREFLPGSLASASSEWATSAALALGTGPSAGSLVGDHTMWTHRIVCN